MFWKTIWCNLMKDFFHAKFYTYSFSSLFTVNFCEFFFCVSSLFADTRLKKIINWFKKQNKTQNPLTEIVSLLCSFWTYKALRKHVAITYPRHAVILLHLLYFLIWKGLIIQNYIIYSNLRFHATWRTADTQYLLSYPLSHAVFPWIDFPTFGF